jgi:hypothetical protein
MVPSKSSYQSGRSAQQRFSNAPSLFHVLRNGPKLVAVKKLSLLSCPSFASQAIISGGAQRSIIPEAHLFIIF